MRFVLAALVVMTLGWQAQAATLVDLPLSQQINLGQGDAISAYTGFGTDGGNGYVQKTLSAGDGAGSWYYGPNVDLSKAGYAPYVDMSATGTTIEYTARYFQGNGNTNPYGDAPIFVQLVDNAGKRGGLGISYGAHPDPTYPSWITCTDDMTTGTSPTDAGFDLSKVVSIKFYGTDWAGTGNDFIQVRNLKIITPIVHNVQPISSAKALADNQTIEISGVVTAVFTAATSQFYVEDPDRCCGIQVRSTTPPARGQTVIVQGAVKTDATTQEMYLQATQWWVTSPSTVSPLVVTTRTLGGGPLGRQQATIGGEGLSNTGLLVRICGIVTAKATGMTYVYITDGTTLANGSVYEGARVDISAIPAMDRPFVTIGDKMILTGISSMHIAGDGKHYRMIKVRDLTDFKNVDDNGNLPKIIRVAVVNFDPYCPGYGNQRTHDVFGWGNPRTLANGYIADLAASSGGWCQYQIVSWYDANYYPIWDDGFQYGADQYVYDWSHRPATVMHSGSTNYVPLVADKTYPHNQGGGGKSLDERIAAGEFDEVFFFSGPNAYAGWEAAMVGPSPFFINGGTYYDPAAGRNFAVMGFNYERGVDCMLEDFCHRTECVMSRVYDPSSWWFPTWPVTNNWDRFRMIDLTHAGSSACGFCHYAPNSDSDYDWGNTRYVYSTCDDWLYNWPNLQGDSTRRLVNCSEWGNGDMRQHHIWWLTHMPKAPFVNPDGKQNNWWKYTCDFNSYPESR